MTVGTETMTCQRCRSLVDVVTERWNQPDTDRERVRCPSCRAGAKWLHPWLTGGPCPRCGSPMQAAGDGAFMLWD